MHIQHLEEIFKRLRGADLKVHPGRCVFGADIIDFLGHHISADSLGHHISADSLQPQEEKLAAVQDLPAPTDLHSLRAAQGLFSY